MWRVRGLVAASWLLAAWAGPAAAEAPVPEAGRRWQVAGPAATDRDISGVACAPGGLCVLVSDNGRRGWYFRLDETARDAPLLVSAEEITLTPGAGFGEADAEAAAFADGRFYAIGSHGSSRRYRQFQPSRFFVYRFAPGQPPEASGAFARIATTVPGIAEVFCTGPGEGQCRSLQAGGANIEGLAVRDGQLYVGFRAPAPGGVAFVVRVAEAAVFGTAPPDPQVFRLPLGQDERGRDLGIRDLAPVAAGFLVLAGPSRPEGDEAVGSGFLFHWRPEDGTVSRLRPVGVREVGVKPEALLVLGEDATGYRVLVLHDGLPGGRPLEYRVPKP